MVGAIASFQPGAVQPGAAALFGRRELPGAEAVSPAPAVTPTAPGTSTAFFSRPLSSGGTLLAAQQSGTPAGSEQQAKNSGELSEEEKAAVAKLKAIDAKVRAHERAHAAVGGQYAGAPSYSYTRGPDGQMYATGGEVSIDISAENDPEATLQKAAQVAAAALAPADPSGQDRAVAAAAQALRLEALAQIRAEKAAEQEAAQAEEAAPAPPVPGAAPESGQAASPGPETPPAPGRDAAAAYRQAANNILSALNRGGVFAAA
jgi:hypothetical protein